MKRERFVQKRREEWKRFEKLLSNLRGARRRRWSSQDLGELARMYRSICYDLSLVRSREWGAHLEIYLNNLVAQGHNFLYRAPPRSVAAVVEFLIAGFPRLLRKHKVFFFLAAGLFCGPFIVAMLLAIYDPVSAEAIVEKSILESVGDMYAEDLYSRIDADFADQRATMAGFYVLNNVGIAFKCFALGVFFGIGTIRELLFNGIVLGTITGYIVSQGNSGNFFSFVISHGSFELTAIVIAGTAGLLIGWGMIHPGKWSRWDSLRRYGQDAIKLVLGAGIMLGVAALIEAFFSPMAIPDTIKFTVGTLLWLVVAFYLVCGGRQFLTRTAESTGLEDSSTGRRAADQ